MTEEEYLTQRVDDQIKWYSAKSQWNQLWYKRARTVEIVAAASVALLAGYGAKSDKIAFLTGLLGALVAAVAGLLSLFKLHENWIEYRGAAEALKREKFLYLTRAGLYKSADRFERLVERVESLLDREHAQWAAQMGEKEKAGKTEPKLSD